MDKRTILALVLTMVLIFVFQSYFMKPAPQPAPTKQPVQTETQSKEKSAEVASKQAQDSSASAGPNVPVMPAKKATRFITAETPLLKIKLSDLGGGLSSVELKKYKATVKGTAGKELIEDIKPYVYIPTVFQTTAGKTISDATVFKADHESITVTDKPEKLILTGTMENGKQLRKIYTFHPDSYTIDVKIETDSPDTKDIYYDLAAISDKKESSYVFKGPFVFNGKSLQQIDKIESTMSFTKDYTYAGFDDGFFAFIWIPTADSKPTLSILKTDTKVPVIRLAADKGPLSGTFYFGPKQTDILKSLNVKAEKIIDYGWFDIIAKPLVIGLNFSNKFTHNYGIDIILLTILIKLIFHPLSVKSYRSMKKMQNLKPMIDKLKEKYANNKEQLNKEMMELYRNKSINPMGGCLPMIIQIPVFFALYKGLSGAIELRHAPFFAWINDLSAPEDLYSFVVAGYTLPIRILPLIMGITQVIQQKMTPTTADPMQEKMMLFMPIVFTFLFWGFPSGLVLYWLVNNVISIGQQYYINKSVK